MRLGPPAFADLPGAVASLHVVDVTADARTHYHRRMTEIYLILEGEGEIELDGARFPIRPMTAIYIRPGCRHRAVGTFKMINVPIPAFDANDEWVRLTRSIGCPSPPSPS
jgi:mannose-6-phosphate isomerase-like protein (cupin superfamily)